MLKLLDKIPEWAGLKRMQSRIDALEAKIAALEAALAAKPPENACPACEGGLLKFVSERPHPAFGRMGQRERTLKCNTCTYTTTRMVDTKVKG